MPEKISALLNLYEGDGLVKAAREIVNNIDSNSQSMKIAIKYLSERDAAAEKKISSLIAHKEEEISEASILAIAKLNPNSVELIDKIEKLLESKSEKEIAFSIKLAAELAKATPRTFLDEDQNIEQRTEKSSGIIQNSIHNGVYFRIWRSISNREASSLSVSFYKNPSSLYYAPADLISGGASRAISKLFHESSTNRSLFIQNIQAFCLEDDGKCWVVLRVEIEGNTKIILENGVEIDQNQAPTGVSLKIDKNEKNPKIIVSWVDRNADSKVGIF